MKALDDFRFQADFIVAVDGTGYLSFSHHHCSRCLTQKHSSGKVSYLHPVLEAKLLTDNGLVHEEILQLFREVFAGQYRVPLPTINA